MKFDFKKFLMLVIVFLVLVVPVAAIKFNDILDISSQLSSSNAPVAHDMNLKLHTNKNYTGKLNANRIKTCTVTNKPKHGTLKLNKTSGKFVYVPNKNFVGTDSFKYKVNNGAKDSRIATVNIKIQNQPPTVTNLNFSLVSGKSYTLKFNGKDADRNPLTYRNITKPLHGTLKLNSNGTFDYTANPGYIGQDSFTYVANDGLSNSKIGKCSMNIVQNSAPEAHDFSFTTHKAYTGYFNANDVNKDILTYQIISQPKYGTLTLNPNGTFTYTPKPGFKGEDEAKYTSNNGLNTSNTASIKINVTNNPPQVTNNIEYINVTQNVTYTGKLTAADADGDPVTFSLYWNGINGDFKINPNGTFTYTNRNCDVKCNFNGTPCVDYTLYEVSYGYVKEKFWIIVYYAK